MFWKRVVASLPAAGVSASLAAMLVVLATASLLKQKQISTYGGLAFKMHKCIELFQVAVHGLIFGQMLANIGCVLC